MCKLSILYRMLLLFVIVPQIHGTYVPNLSIGMNDDLYYCLLYKDRSDSTITWDYRDDFPDGYDERYNEYFYCYIISTKNICSRHKDDQGTFVSDYWDGPPVLNHLWQEFQPHSWEEIYKINNFNTFQISLSLKSYRQRIFLCDQETIDSDCVDIFLKTYGAQIHRRKCTVDSVPRDCIHLHAKDVEYEFPLINFIEWHHFSIKMENNTYSVLKYGRNESIITYTDNDNPRLEPKYIIFGTNTLSEILKIHRVNALAYNKSSVAKIKITAPKYCVLIFVKTCKNCTVEIKVHNTNMSVIYQTLVKQAEGWQQVSLKMEPAREKDVLIIAKVSNKDDETSEEMWYISDAILRCHSNELQPMFTNKHGCCYALMYPQYRMCTNALKEYNPRDTKCPADTIGKNCISCKALFNDDCPFYPICDLTRNGAQCSCPAGYYGSYCKERCPNQSFGFDCKQECGQCLASCDHVHGFCHYNACLDNYTGKYCNTTFRSITANLPIPIVISRNSTSAIISVKVREFINTTTPSSYSLEIKGGESFKSWYTLGVADMNSNNHTFVVHNISPEEIYELRTVFRNENGSLYPGIDDRNVPIIILQKFCRNLTLQDLQVKLTNTTFLFEVKDYLASNKCRLDRYDYILRSKAFRRTGVLKRTVLVDGLQPNTQYTFTIMLVGHDIFSANYTTDMGVCDPIYNLHGTSSDTSIKLRWQKPLKSYCIINYYIVEYKLTQYLTCKIDNKVESTQESITTKNEQVKLEKLHPSSKYQINIYAVSKYRGRPFKIYDVTQASNITVEDVPAMSIYNSAKNLTLVLQGDCKKQTGSAEYYLDLICKSNWCFNQKFGSSTYKSFENRQIVSFKTIPYTEYQIETHIYRTGVPKYTNSTRIRTDSAVPGAVLDLMFHSANSTSVGLRWLPPNPPMSVIDSYEITAHHGNITVKISYPAILTNKCTLWDGYCYTFDDLLTKVEYKFTVSAVNAKKNTKGDPAIITVFTINQPPSPPLNITATWKEGQILTIHWLHPLQPHGHISRFHIRVNETEEKIYYVTKPSPAYEYSVDVSNVTAQSILVTIAADNNVAETKASSSIYTPPKTPEFISEPHLELTSESSVRITLPYVKNQDGSSYMYIILSDIHHPIAANNNAYFKEYFDGLGVDGAHSGFIAIFVLKQNELPERVEYKNDRIRIRVFDQYSEIPEGTLQSGHSYRVTIVLNNTFKGFSNYNVYHLSFTLDVSLYFLALLLIPAVLGAVLCAVITRRFYLKSKNRNSLLNDDVQSDISEEHIYESASDVLGGPLDHNLSTSTIENSASKLLGQFTFEKLSIIRKKYTKIVNIRDLDQYVKDSINNEDLAKQFQKIYDCPTKPSKCGNDPENKLKNMIPDLAAYDHTRVKLDSIYENPISDYINANFINGYSEKNTYIATQGPKSNTINDFWSMIWQERVEYIIAVSGVIEGATRKFEKYWPEINGFSTFGEIQVLFTKVEIFANYKIRYFTVTFEEVSRIVTQFQFCCPTDVGAPQYIRSFVSFSKRILGLTVGESPIVVHGRDGFGRTGILILCDICLRMALVEGKIDILNQLYKMRQQRVNMIENVDQYKMVHFILLLILQCVRVPSQNGISCNNNTMNYEVEDTIATKIEKQLKFLDDSAWQDEAMRCINLDSKRPNINAKKKLKIQTEYADDFTNASFFPYSSDNPDQIYIRAEVVDSFLIPSKFITTSNPTNSTLGVFWKLIIEKKIKLIISLSKLNPTDTAASMFYPTSNASFINPLPNIKVKFASKQRNTYCDIYHVNITQDDNPYQPTPLIVIQLREWHQSVLHPEKPNGLIACYESMNDLGKLSSTILVTCHDGIRACGLYVAFCYLVDKIQADHICDVCLAVQTVRQSRREFVRPIEQFQFLYRCGLEFVKQFENYANFNSKTNI